MKNTMLFLFLFVFAGLTACQSDKNTSDNNDSSSTIGDANAQTVSAKDTTPDLAARVDTAALRKQLGGAGVKVTPMDNPPVDSKKSNLTEEEKRMLWNEKISEQIHIAMKTMVTEYNKGTFKNKMTTTPSGLQYMVLEKGTGEKVPAGKVAYIHNMVTLKDGTMIESNFKHNDPLRVRLDSGSTIPGMEEAIKTMDINSNYLFMIPAELAYGKGVTLQLYLPMRT
jgi:FKBP-type peptidyl-prolyl cis-trans isomerase